MKKLFSALTPFERGLWLVSVCAITAAFLLSGGSALSMTASLIGVTALIFVAKGYVIGQVLTVVFAAFYGVISYFFRYYGEMITYLGMTAPIAALAVISWLRHPYEGTREVEVSRLRPAHAVLMLALAAGVTAVFYFILRALGNAQLAISTLSVTTSFLACSLTFLRSPYYALAYAANDLVLIALWVLAAKTDPSCLPMVICFIMFFANDLYGYYNWSRMRRRQEGRHEDNGRLLRRDFRRKTL